MSKSPTRPTGFERAKAWLVGLTGILLVIPALINGGIDIYSALAKLPKTESERINVELYTKYFNKQPVASFPVPVKQNNGTVDVRFAVYEEGDVFVEFGKYTQWFPFPKPAPNKISLSFIEQAFAADPDKVRGYGNYQQKDTLVQGYLMREREWENGVVEKMRVNPRTGDITEHNTYKAPASLTGSNPTKLRSIGGVNQIATIDLDAFRNKEKPAASASAMAKLSTSCTTSLGSCKILSPIVAGAHCNCVSALGSVTGIAN